MKKGKSVIALLLVFVLLVGGMVTYIAVSNLQDNEPDETDAPSEVEYLLSIKKEDVDELTIENEDGSFVYELVQTNADKEDQDPVYGFELISPELENLNGSTATAKANALMSIRIDSEANSDAANLADYGLDEPTATVTIKLKDGSTKVVHMGDVLRNQTAKSYARLEGSNRVVVANGLPSSMVFTKTDLVSTAILDIQLYEVEAFDFIRKRDQMNAHIQVQEDELSADVTPTPEPEVTPSAAELNDAAMMRFWEFTEPFAWAADSTDINAMLAEFVSISAKSVVATTIDDPAKYGLDDPAYEYTLYTAGEEVTLSFGNEESSGIRYLSVSGRDELMTVSMSTFTLIDRPQVELVDSFVTLINIADVGQIQLTTPEKHYDMDVFHPSNAELEEDEDLDYIYTINGQDASIVNRSGDYYFRKVYSGILSLMVDGEDLDATPTGDAVYEVVITKRTGDKESISFDLYPRNEQSFYLFKDGEYTGFFTRRNRVDNDTANLSNLGLLQLLERMEIAMDNHVDGKYIFPDD